jgi:cytochrome d ubiquinol oxidase subunit I
MAVMEALYEGKEGAPFSVVAFGKSAGDPQRPYMREQVDITIPKILSIIAKGDANAFVPGIVDLIEGNNKHDIMPARERARRGKQAQETLKAMTDAKDVDAAEYARLRAMFDDKVWVDNYLVHFGYGYFYDENPQKMTEKIAKLVPNVPLNYWSFRIMIGLGFLFIAVFVLLGWFAHKNTLENRTKLYKLAIVCIPLVYISTWAGWIVAEVGRQPWIVQDLMPTFAGTTSEMATSAVKTTFFLFAVTFTVLLVAALKIVFTQIKKGPKEE